MLNYKYLLALIVLASYVQAAAIPQGAAFRAAGLYNVESDALTLKEPAFDDTSTISHSDHVYLVETEHPPEEPRNIVKDVEKVLSHLRRSDHVYLVETEHPSEEPRVLCRESAQPPSPFLMRPLEVNSIEVWSLLRKRKAKTTGREVWVK
ncbi:hypothetical protein BT96DRAFT_946384 [Gymnopus androsaceus JB14]|uniref:Uncharacterized protein n=1 Tax=Gymnopus androsaceus JB14 TaxID=1447944 RepID=A0A6A4GWG2_9AGAR|nr:hypothetical protein BT96DRAFT_946384 [Gymnopus androsaceus JB14]